MVKNGMRCFEREYWKRSSEPVSYYFQDVLLDAGIGIVIYSLWCQIITVG